MEVSKEELLHIAKLADLKISSDETENYLRNLQDILSYTEVLEKTPVDELSETIGANDNENVFRKDEVEEFKDKNMILENAPDTDNNMYKVPKVLG